MRARLQSWKSVQGLERAARLRLDIQHVGALERIARDRLSNQCDAEAHALSQWTRKRLTTDRPTPPAKRPLSTVMAIMEPPEDMRSMEIPLEDGGHAIVLTGLELPDRLAIDHTPTTWVRQG